jgi:hypothetical protein
MTLSKEWQHYLGCLDRTVTAVELTAFHTKECADAVDTCVEECEEVVSRVRRYLDGNLKRF